MLSRVLITIVAMFLGNVSCATRQPAQVRPAPAKNAYHSTSPASLSEYIRTVMKISQENSPGREEKLVRLHAERPDLPALLQRTADDPDDLSARRGLASAYAREGLHADALRLFQEVIERQPDDAQAELGLAGIWNDWGNYAQARRHAERAAGLDPKGLEALGLLGQICLRQKDVDGAGKAFEAAGRIAPADASILANIGYVRLLRSDWEGARNSLLRALELDPTIVEARNHLGIVMAHVGDRDAALRYFLEAGPPATALNNLGTVFLAQNRLEEARAEFMRALSLDPGHAKARENLLTTESLLPPPVVFTLRPFSPGIPPEGRRASNTFGAVNPVPLPSVGQASTYDVGGAATGETLKPEVPIQLSYELPGLSLPGQGDPRSGPFEETMASPAMTADPGSSASEPAAKAPDAESPRAAVPDRQEGTHRALPARKAQRPVTERSSPRAGYAIQVAAVKTEADADAEVEKLARASLSPQSSRTDLGQGGVWYRVRLRGYDSFTLALKAANRILGMGLIRRFWITRDGT